MNKTELIDAIQQVITPNGQKAITAESLANLLIEMVEAMGEDSKDSSGGISFIVKISIDEGGSMISALTVEDIAYNKSQIEVLKQLKESGKSVPPIAINMSSDGLDGELGFIQYCMSQVLWDSPPEEDLPEGIVFPCVTSEIPFIVNGDGNLLSL